MWRSCANSAAINSRLSAHRRPAAHLLSYPDAGHLVGGVPYLPSTVTQPRTADGQTLLAGGSPQADQEAHADGWPAVLQFLSSLAS